MNNEAYLQLLPMITDSNRLFWEGCTVGELRLQACDECGRSRFPESPVCPACLSGRFTWKASAGHATLWSWITMHQRYLEAFSDELPYLIAFVQLDEGPFMTSTLVDPPDDLRCGMPLQVTFSRVSEERSIPKFRVVS